MQAGAKQAKAPVQNFWSVFESKCVRAHARFGEGERRIVRKENRERHRIRVEERQTVLTDWREERERKE